MKKTILFFAALAAVAVASCQKEAAFEESQKALTPKTLKTFTAGYDEETKTGLGADKSVTWAESDQIIVYSQDGQTATYSVPAEDAGKASISFSVSVGDAPFYAVVCRSSSKVKYFSDTLAVNQVPQLTGAWSSNDALVASTSGNTFAFKHTTGYMHFSTSKTVASVHVSCGVGVTPANSPCFGTVNVAFDEVGGEPKIMIPAAYNPGAKGSGNDGFGKLSNFAIYKTRDNYYFPIIPGTHNVISIMLVTGDNKYFTARIPSVTVERGKIIELGNIDSHCTEQNIVFYESFDKCKGIGGNDCFWKNDYKTTGTADNSWTIESCGQGAGWACMILGSNGSITSPALGLTGNAIINFKIACYNVTADKGNDVTLSVVGNGTLSQTTFNVGTSFGFATYNVNLTGADKDTKIKFAYPKRCYIDEIMVFNDNGTVTGDAYVQVNTEPADWSGKYLLVTCPRGQYKVIDRTISGTASFTMAVDPVSVSGGKIAHTTTLQAAEFELEPSGLTEGTYAGSYLVKYNGQYLEDYNGGAQFTLVADKANISNYAYWNVSLTNGCIKIANIITGASKATNLRSIAYYEEYDRGSYGCIQPLKTDGSDYFKNNLYAFKYTPAE